MTPREAIPQDWTERLSETGRVALGLDLATTEKKTSNPASFTVFQEHGKRFVARLIVSWKTADPDVTTQLVAAVVDDLIAANHPPVRLVIDASNEVFFARLLQKSLRPKVQCLLIKGSEKIKYENEEMDSKTLLGNLFANHIDDGLILLPSGKWIADDYRLVGKEAGRFVTSLGKSGEHGDNFDSGKLALWGLLGRTGSAVGVEGVAVGDYGQKSKKGRWKGMLKSKRRGGNLTT